MSSLLSLLRNIGNLNGGAPLRALYGLPGWPSAPNTNSIHNKSEIEELYVLVFAFFGALWVIVSPLKPRIRVRWCITNHDLNFLESDLSCNAYRTKINFLTANEAPKMPDHVKAFQTSYLNNRGHLYTRIFRTSLFRADRVIVSVGVLGLLLTWFIRNSITIHRLNTSNGFFEPSTVRTNIAAVATVHEIVLPFASMALSVMAILHVWWLYKLIDHAWLLQGKIYDLALLLSSVLMSHRSDPRIQDAFWTIYRHLNLVHVFTYEQISESVWTQSKDLDKVEMCNFLTATETDELREVEDRLGLVFVWLSDMLNRLVDAELVPAIFTGSFLESFSEINAAATTYIAQARRSSKMVPTPARRVIELSVDIMIMLTPAALAHLFSRDDSAFPCYFWPCFGSMVTAMCFQGVVCLIKALDKPFENHLDGLHPDYALYLTERRIFACLAGGENWPPPPAPEAPSMSRLLRSHFGRDFSERVDSDLSVAPKKTVGSIDGDDDERGEEIPEDAADMQRPHRMSHRLSGTNIRHSLNALEQNPPPHEDVPADVPWVPQEVGNLGVDSHISNTRTQAALPDTEVFDEKYVKGARWGNLDHGLLQATKAALLVPREITLDQVSLERLETVTARPLAELAAAIFRAERAETRRVEAESGMNGPLAIEDQRGIQQQFAHVRGASDGTETASAAISLLGTYEQELQHSSNLKEELAKLKAHDIVAAAEASKRPREKPSFNNTAQIADV